MHSAGRRILLLRPTRMSLVVGRCPSVRNPGETPTLYFFHGARIPALTSIYARIRDQTPQPSQVRWEEFGQCCHLFVAVMQTR
eukprot:scaffold3100_cov248-Pinguiococcus_pyrenoidosus.AAC.1